MSFWYNKSQFKICSSEENRKIANCIVSVFLKQRQISKTNHLKTMKAHADLGENDCWGRADYFCVIHEIFIVLVNLGASEFARPPGN